MKKWMVLALSLALIKLQAAHLQSTVTVTLKGEEYLVDVQIEKIVGDQSELVANPKLICGVGEPAELEVGSKEESDSLAVKAVVSETGKNIETSIFMKEEGQIVLSSHQIVKLQ